MLLWQTTYTSCKGFWHTIFCSSSILIITCQLYWWKMNIYNTFWKQGVPGPARTRWGESARGKQDQFTFHKLTSLGKQRTLFWHVYLTPSCLWGVAQLIVPSQEDVLTSTPKSDKQGKQSSFVFSKSMLNEFLYLLKAVYNFGSGKVNHFM